jgi:hypothetical protein
MHDSYPVAMRSKFTMSVGAKAHVTDDVPPGVVWILDGWVGLNHLTSGDAVLNGDALRLFPFSVGQSDYGVKVEVARG